MSATFVTQLRSARPAITLVDADAGAITLRVQCAELWDTVRVVARPDSPVATVKQRVVAELYPPHQFADDFVLKLRGWEILDERQSLADSGVVNGSIVLLSYRRRRPIR